MAVPHGSKAAFKLDNSGGALQDLSAYVTSVSLPRTIDVAETSAFGTTAKTYVVGLTDATITLEGVWDPTLDAHMGAILGQAATVTFEVGPEGSTAGKVRYTGEAIVTAYDPGDTMDDAAKWTATLQVSGAITRNTF